MVRRAALLGVLGGLAAVSCLFSTQRPRTAESPVEPPDPDMVVITGAVTHFDPHTHQRRNMPGRYVNADFFVSAMENGVPTQVRIWSTVVSSHGAGVYEVRYKNRNVVAAELKALRCEVDPADPPLECCELTSNCPEQCRIWTAPQRFNVTPGKAVQRDLTVSCSNGVP